MSDSEAAYWASIQAPGQMAYWATERMEWRCCCLGTEDEKALRIGRAVLAMKKRHEGNGWMDEYEQGARDGYNDLLAYLLAAGEAEG